MLCWGRGGIKNSPKKSDVFYVQPPSSLMMAEKTIHNPNKYCALVVTSNAVTRIGQGKTRVCPDYANHTSITLCVNHVERVFVT